jgi:hypothetical protein
VLAGDRLVAINGVPVEMQVPLIKKKKGSV